MKRGFFAQDLFSIVSAVLFFYTLLDSFFVCEFYEVEFFASR